MFQINLLLPYNNYCECPPLYYRGFFLNTLLQGSILSIEFKEMKSLYKKTYAEMLQ